MKNDVQFIGEAVVDYLSSYQVKHVFGIPGTHSIELYRGLEKSTLHHVLTRHEQGAGFMADGYARQSGKPGVCFVITGPGATNTLTAIAQAYSDSIPLLVFSPINDMLSNGYNAGRLHEIGDQAAVFKPVTAFSEVAQNESMLRELIDRAFAMFQSERPRPAHIHIPLSLLRSQSSDNWLRPSGLPERSLDVSKIDDILSAVAQSCSPIIVAGGGCRGVGASVVNLAERIGCPMLTTVAGRGVVPASHALGVGAQIAAPQVQQQLASSDLAIVLGSELAEPDHWTEQLKLPVKQIWVNLDAELLSYKNPTIAIQGSVGSMLAALNPRISYPDKLLTREQYAQCKKVRELHGRHFTPIQKTHWRVLTEIIKVLPKPSTVCSDMTQIAYTAIEHLPLSEGIDWFHPNGYGTLGYALPAAIGAKLAQPDNSVLAIVGDAGFQYTASEMGVAAEQQLNVVVLLWQNSALQQISDDMVEAGIPPNAVEQQNPDFVALAKSYRWLAQNVMGLAELGAALENAFFQSRPVLLVLDAASV